MNLIKSGWKKILIYFSYYESVTQKEREQKAKLKCLLGLCTRPVKLATLFASFSEATVCY